MISLSLFCSDLRNRSGIDLEASRIGDSQSDLRFRVRGLPRTYSFSLRMSRAWRSSQLIFEPDTFSQFAIAAMVSKIDENREEVANFISSAQSRLSSFDVRIDGRHVNEIGALQDASSSQLRVLAEVFSEESIASTEFLSDSESHLVETVVDFVIYLLSEDEANYKTAEEVHGFPEGAVETVLVNRYERDGRNRAIAIRTHGLRCAVCDFNFGEFYGPLGYGFIVVHHVVPVSKLGVDYVINPVSDLACICANCHAMVHRTDPPIAIAELREQVKSTRSTTSE